MFKSLLTNPGVTEVLRLGSTFGIMAFHGGYLEKVTDLIADEVAQMTGCSYYGVIQGESVPTHVPSKLVDPEQSASLASFLSHVDVAVALHGYGRENLRRVMLLGGSHRGLARHLSRQLSRDLPDYEARHEIDEIPRELRGLHPDNPVNRPRLGGVQIELPPTLRWNFKEKNWSDFGGAGRAQQVDDLITSLSTAINIWNPSAVSPA